jgi:hypothetical protein
MALRCEGKVAKVSSPPCERVSYGIRIYLVRIRPKNKAHLETMDKAQEQRLLHSGPRLCSCMLELSGSECGDDAEPGVRLPRLAGLDWRGDACLSRRLVLQHTTVRMLSKHLHTRGGWRPNESDCLDDCMS